MSGEMKIVDTLKKGDKLATLKALQNKIARTIDESKSGRDIAALSKQLREVTEEIAEVKITEGSRSTVLEEIIKKHNDY